MERKEESVKIKKSKRDIKVVKLFKKLGAIVFICLVLLIFLTIIINIYFNKKSGLENTIKTLTIENNKITSEIRNIELKSETAKNYIKAWETDFPEEQKLLNGINIGDIESKIGDMAKRNYINEYVLNFSPVLAMDGPFERANVKTFTTLVGIKFSALDDVHFYRFLDDLKQNLGYFIVVRELSLERNGSVDSDFLDSLSIGNIKSTVIGEMKIRIYGLGLK